MDNRARRTWRAYPPVFARSECTICHGTGWQLLSARGSSRARRCSCSALDRVIRLRQDVRIPPQYHHFTLDAYQPENISQAQALSEAQRFADRFPRVDRGLLFVGGTGAGKTHLAVGVLLKLLQRFHEDLLFLEFQELGPSPGGMARCGLAEDNQRSRARTCSLLVLDNLASGEDDGQMAAAREILMTRLQARKVTLLTASRSFSLRGGPCALYPESNRGRDIPGVAHAAVHFMNGFKILRMRAEGRGHDFSGAYPLFRAS